MKYVKLTAKPDTWFKQGTEVYDYDCDPPDNLKRITLEEWESIVNFNGFKCILVRGIHVITCEIDAQNRNSKIGDEDWDGELCGIDEFEVEILNEPF